MEMEKQDGFKNESIPIFPNEVTYSDKIFCVSLCNKKKFIDVYIDVLHQ